MTRSILLALIFLVGHPLIGSALACDIALVLSHDVSKSIDGEEYLLAREGVAAALLHPSIVESFEEGEVWMTVQEWANEPITVMPWRKVEGKQGLTEVASFLMEAPRTTVAAIGYNTAMGLAMIGAVTALNDGPDCDRRVIDIATDGESNAGVHPREVHPGLDKTIQINVLAIELVKGSEAMLWEHVVQGPGGFLKSTSWEQFPEAMRQKMNQELFLSELIQ